MFAWSKGNYPHGVMGKVVKCCLAYWAAAAGIGPTQWVDSEASK